MSEGFFAQSGITNQTPAVPPLANTLVQKPNAARPPFRLRDIPRMFLDYMNREQGLWRKRQDRQEQFDNMLLDRIVNGFGPPAAPMPPKVQGLPEPTEELAQLYAGRPLPQMPPVRPGSVLAMLPGALGR